MAAFRDVAKRYVAVIESAGDGSADDLFRALASVLPALYEAALRLPDLIAETD